MKQKHLFWGAAVALTFLFSASAIAQPRHTKKKVKKVVEAKAGVCPFTDKWVEDETKFEDRKEKAHATFVPYSSTATIAAGMIITKTVKDNETHFYRFKEKVVIT
jgi:hypothetical protein